MRWVRPIPSQRLVKEPDVRGLRISDSYRRAGPYGHNSVPIKLSIPLNKMALHVVIMLQQSQRRDLQQETPSTPSNTVAHGYHQELHAPCQEQAWAVRPRRVPRCNRAHERRSSTALPPPRYFMRGCFLRGRFRSTAPSIGHATFSVVFPHFS